ncbi:hypothetical protein ACOMHN_038957 [Nucella lapillus]
MAQRTIIIAVDGSGAANMAFDWYLNNLSRPDDFVLIVHVPELDFGIGLPGAAVDVQAVTQAAKKENDRIDIMMNSYMDKLRPINIKSQCKLKTGQKPGEAIISVAEESRANIVIMGSRGLGTIRRTFLGSVSEYVIHHAPKHCAVTIIRES